LRKASDADYPMQVLANCIEQALDNSVPDLTELHLPFVSWDEYHSDDNVDWEKVSVARCAQISYNRVFEKNVIKDLVRYDKLFAGKHWSAFEHTATASFFYENKSDPLFNGWHKNLYGWRSVRCDIVGEEDASL
jgi:hypothetical protein